MPGTVRLDSRLAHVGAFLRSQLGRSSARRLARLWARNGPPALRSHSRTADVEQRSFDIFETLLTVAIAPSPAIWLLLGRRLQPFTGLSDVDFEAARRQAILALERDGRPVTLESIYQELGEGHGLPSATIRMLIEAELDLFSELLRPIAVGQRAIAQARAASDGSCLFISDMHLPAGFLRQQLARWEMWRPGDRIWVSGEAGARKVDGQLFTLVESHDAIARHVGDDRFSDVVAARWVGWPSTHARWGEPTRSERLLSASKEASSGSITSALAGVSRQHRLLDPRRAPLAAALREVASDIAGPVLTLYALWLLARARERGLERLYFVSRDGYLLREVTQLLAERLRVAVELQYLYGGRAPWQRAGMGLEGSGSLVAHVAEQELTRYERVTLGRLSRRVGLAPAELQSQLGGPMLDDDELLIPSARRRLLRFLTSSDGASAVQHVTKHDTGLALDYLRQEGLLRDGSWAVVDVGWRGNTVQALDRLLGHAGERVRCALFAGYLGDTDDSDVYRAFLWDSRDPSVPPPPPGAVSIFEAFCSGPHGPVLGYERRPDGRVGPVLVRPQSAAQQTWALDDFRSSVLGFVERASEVAQPEWLEEPTAEVARGLMEEVSLRPSRAVARVLGACPREEDALGDVVYPLARPFRASDLPVLLSSDATSVARNLAWPTGAVAATSFPMRAVFGPLVSIVRFASSARASVGRWRATLDQRHIEPGVMTVSTTSEPALRSLLAEDFRTHGRAPTSPGFQAIAAHRLARAANASRSPLAPVLRAIATILFVLVRNLYGIELPPKASIGRRVKISHQSGIVVSGDAVIGDDCRLRQNVTIGSRGKTDPRSGRRKPVLEEGVYVGAGAIILGGITVGAGARIGANALVVEDVPAGARVFAPAATIVTVESHEDDA
jgi:serine acetyltransferase/FMN phosphatase YigB (HAD superfamily)